MLIQPVVEEWVKTFCFPPCDPKTIHLEKYEHVAALLDAAMVPYDHRVIVSVSRKEVLYLRNML